ncbi:MAG: hypothetical protein IIZ93_00920 [Acidaminococcaceae bacterium]|nr:hypothetical protein [Acidaminococcaceae bacterium]
MKFGQAYKILENIDSDVYTVDEKAMAIKVILDMETHNGVTKAVLLKAMNWLWNEHYELID